ncbi:MAG TPA: NTP transferase domain-containing protein [Steroidobacter sp.]
MSSGLFGLVLAGGASTRMRSDKATLDYHGRPQLSWACDLLSGVCEKAFVSVRPDQRNEPARAAYPQIVDREPGLGPIAGISAALSEHPHVAWLVLACDLPFLTPAVLKHLIDHRDPKRTATAYRSSHDALPEPLCAIWEPSARKLLAAYMASGKQCPRKFLINADVRLIDLPDARALDNVNTEQEFAQAASTLRPGQTSAGRANQKPGKSRTVRVQYFAVLREQAGRSEEVLDTTAATPAQLYSELRGRYRFQLAPAQLKVALNSEFCDWNAPLAAGDTVVFIPPVAGG